MVAFGSVPLNFHIRHTSRGRIQSQGGIEVAILTNVDMERRAALGIADAVGEPLVFLGVGQEHAEAVRQDQRGRSAAR